MKRVKDGAKKYFFKNEDILNYYELADEFEKNRSASSEYKLWLFVQKCFPKLDLAGGGWSLGGIGIFTPYLIKSDDLIDFDE